MAIILGLDPGTRTTGFGCIEWPENLRGQTQPRLLGCGIISLESAVSLPQRLCELSDNLRELILKWSPDDIVVEKVFLGKSADSAFKLGHARGVILAEAARCASAKVHEYATRQVKQGVGGSGSADKMQVMARVQYFLGLQKIDSLDASDALALALFHGQNRHVELIHRKMNLGFTKGMS